MKVREKMTQDLVAVDSSATAEDVAKKMDEENVGTVLVMDQGKLKGLVTDRQIAIKSSCRGGPFKAQGKRFYDPGSSYIEP